MNPRETDVLSLWAKLLLFLKDWITNLLKLDTPVVAQTSKIDAWCEAIKQFEGWHVGSRSERNNNVGNIRYVGQVGAHDDGAHFAVFPTYEAGYQALKTLLTNACTGKSKIYKPEMTLLDFYKIYAPSFDSNDPNAYADFIAKTLGVPVTTQIKDLV